PSVRKGRAVASQRKTASVRQARGASNANTTADVTTHRRWTFTPLPAREQSARPSVAQHERSQGTCRREPEAPRKRTTTSARGVRGVLDLGCRCHGRCDEASALQNSACIEGARPTIIRSRNEAVVARGHDERHAVEGKRSPWGAR